MTKTRREQILNNLIDMYLKELSPVASNQLKNEFELPFSSSTIRNYFKQLSDEGLIIRVHISSGSVPSEEAMQNYWSKHLNYSFINIESSSQFIEEVSKEFGIFSIIKSSNNFVLNEVLNFNNRFIILVLDEKEVILKYSYEVFTLLTQFKGYNVEELSKLLNELNLSWIVSKLSSLDEYSLFNREYLYDNYKDLEVENFLNAKIFNYLDNKIVFNSDYLLYNTDVEYQNKSSKILCVGSLYTNYEEFFQILTKGGVK